MLRSYINNVTLHIGRTHARAVMPHVLELMVDGWLCRAGAVKTILIAS